MMRLLGVARWNGIELGPDPATPKSEPETQSSKRERRPLLRRAGIRPVSLVPDD